MKRPVSPQELAARKHYTVRGEPNGPWAELDAAQRAVEVIAFQSALEVIRQPNKPMLKAACKAMSPTHRPTPQRVSVEAMHGIRFRAMLDVLLQPTVLAGAGGLFVVNYPAKSDTAQPDVGSAYPNSERDA